MDIGMGETQVRVGVESFSDFAHVKLTMRNSTNKTNLEKKVETLSRDNAPWTNTGDALRTLLSTMFKEEHGSRPNVKHVAILLTDGNSQDKEATLHAADACHDANIKVFAIAIGDYIDHREVKAIASNPKAKYYFKTKNFDTLNEILDNLIGRSCKDEKPECPEHPIDLVFILDDSNTIWDKLFQKQLNFVNNFIDLMNVGMGVNQVRVGVETFSEFAHAKVTMGNSIDKASLKKRIRAISRENAPWTNTGDALRKLLSTMFKEEHGSRPNVKRVAILLTDGNSQNKEATLQAADACHDANIKVFAVAIGDNIDYTEVKAIASDPKARFYFQIPDFDALDKISNSLIHRTCKEVKPPLNCQGNPVDIVFVLDGSNSIEDPHFEQELNFTSNFIEEFDIGLGDNQVRVGVEIFSNYTQMVTLRRKKQP
ncbi:COL6A [Acanthosepion pharaonis]|uniref:COL6A n=1 Tax=Acanthosepion pharaonis TaxID=158019 RepID=A0A812BMN0_ACAPH|nr:COL6A [Sepia pharaonis]